MPRREQHDIKREIWLMIFFHDICLFAFGISYWKEGYLCMEKIHSFSKSHKNPEIMKTLKDSMAILGKQDKKQGLS